jgi:hypothetical protein
MQNNKILFTFTVLFLIVALFTTPVKSQVTIGDLGTPESFSLLELVTTRHKGGLRLPQLTTAERDALDLASDPEAAEGLLIYNTDTNCIEYWNLSKWVSDEAPAPAPIAGARTITSVDVMFDTQNQTLEVYFTEDKQPANFEWYVKEKDADDNTYMVIKEATNAAKFTIPDDFMYSYGYLDNQHSNASVELTFRCLVSNSDNTTPTAFTIDILFN